MTKGVYIAKTDSLLNLIQNLLARPSSMLMLLLPDVVVQDGADAIDRGGIAILAGMKDLRVGKVRLVKLDRSELRKYSDEEVLIGFGEVNKSRRIKNRERWNCSCVVWDGDWGVLVWKRKGRTRELFFLFVFFNLQVGLDGFFWFWSWTLDFSCCSYCGSCCGGGGGGGLIGWAWFVGLVCDGGGIFGFDAWIFSIFGKCIDFKDVPFLLP